MEVYFAGLDEFVQKLRDMGARRIPNYVARGLNAIASDTQDRMTEHVAEKLQVRGHWIKKGTFYGINLVKATSQTLVATIWTQAPWLWMQEKKDAKAERDVGGKKIAVPLSTIRPMGRKEPGILPARLRPAGFKGQGVVLDTAVGPILFRRTGRKGRRTLQAMYALEKTVPIPARITMEKVGKEYAVRVTPEALGRILDQALRERD